MLAALLCVLAPALPLGRDGADTLQPPSNHTAVLYDDRDQSHTALCGPTAANTHGVLPFDQQCPPGSTGCWPPLYLLGVQKAATTSIAMGLLRCGSVCFGLPDAKTGVNPTCNGPLGGYNTPCKETMHPPIEVLTAAGQAMTALSWGV